MKIKNILILTLASVLLLMFGACSDITESGSPITTADNGIAPEESQKFVIEYPADMQSYGYTTPLVLNALPQRIVSISTTPVLALYELNANIVGVVSSSVVTWPEDMNAEILPYSAMSDQFDIELVVALSPDLVIMGMSSAETHGKTLEDLNIPVYYVYSGHVVTYNSIRIGTQALIDAFGINDTSIAAGKAINKRFEDLEAKLETLKAVYSDKSVMVLQSGSSTMHYIQTSGGTLASMLDMMGFQNVYKNDQASMALMDMEVALEYDPDLVVCVGGTDAETHQTVMEEAFALNPEYWNSIQAVAEGEILYMPVAYVSSAGINVIDNITALIEIVETHYENK